MTELIWDGKYGPDGKQTRPVRVALPFQDVETVNESAQTRNLMLDLFARNQPSEWRNCPTWLANAHAALDRAVWLAYGWPEAPDATDDETILSRLLALNLEWAGT